MLAYLPYAVVEEIPRTNVPERPGCVSICVTRCCALRAGEMLASSHTSTTTHRHLYSRKTPASHIRQFAVAPRTHTHPKFATLERLPPRINNTSAAAAAAGTQPCQTETTRSTCSVCSFQLFRRILFERHIPSPARGNPALRARVLATLAPPGRLARTHIGPPPAGSLMRSLARSRTHAHPHR